MTQVLGLKDCIEKLFMEKTNSLPLIAHDEILDIKQQQQWTRDFKILYLYGEYLLPLKSIMRHKP